MKSLEKRKYDNVTTISCYCCCCCCLSGVAAHAMLIMLIFEGDRGINFSDILKVLLIRRTSCLISPTFLDVSEVVDFESILVNGETGFVKNCIKWILT